MSWSTVNILPLRNICTRETTNQCCGSGSRFGSARERIELAVLDPDPDQYWECGSGSIGIEIGQNLQKNLASSLLKRLMYLRINVYYYLLPTLIM